jgi:hypothetical protein
MSRTSVIAAALTALALTAPLAPPAHATSPSAPQPTQAQPTKISHSEYEKFMSGLQAHQYNFDGLEQQFTTLANALRTVANEMTPLMGQEDSVSQAAMQTQVAAAEANVQSLAQWREVTLPIFDKACTRFQKRYVKSWSTQPERNRMTKGVEGMRDAFHQFFNTNVKTLQDAAERLTEEDVSGFWELLALAEGGQAFSRQAFDKAYRSLVRM